MRSHLEVPFVALAAVLLIPLLGASPGLAQVPPGPPLPPARADQLVKFQLSDETLRELAKYPPLVGQEYAFDLCRGSVATEADPGRLNPSDSPCGDPLNPSTTVTGGNPPYHFQLDTMGGFPPMGMWVDLNGVLRGTPKNTRGSTFSVCAVDLSERYECRKITIEPKPAPQGLAVSANKKTGGSGGKAAVFALGLGVAAGAAVYAGKLAGDLATMSTGSCASSRFCIVSVMSSGCSCAGSVSGGCDWTGPTVGSGGSCGSGAPCASGLSCNNGRCEGPSGRCPF